MGGLGFFFVIMVHRRGIFLLRDEDVDVDGVEINDDEISGDFEYLKYDLVSRIYCQSLSVK